MKNIFFFTFLFLLSFNGYSQSDTQKLEKLLTTADSLLDINGKQSIFLAKSVLENAVTTDSQYIRSVSLIESAYLMKRDYDSAVLYTNKGLEKALAIKDSLNSIKFYLSRGIDYYFKNDYKNALTDYYDAKTIYETLSNSLKKELSPLQYAKLLNNIASVYSKTSTLDSTLVYMYKSLKIKEANNAKPRSLAISKLNIASVYIKLKDFRNGKSLLNKALDDVLILKDSALMAACYTNLGVVNKQLNDTLQAIENYKKSLEINTQLKRVRGQAIVSQNLAELYSSQNKNKQARYYFNQAISLNKKRNANNAGPHLGIGKLFLIEQDYNSAIYHNKRAIELAIQNNNIDVQLAANKYLTDAYKAIQKPTKAILHLEEYIVLKDSILDNEKQEFISVLKTEFETEKKENEIAYLKKLNESENLKAAVIQSRQRIVIITIILALALLSVLSLFYISKKKKEKRLLDIELQNKELINKEFQTDLDYKTKQLTTHALNMLQKNKLLSDVRDKVKKMASKTDTVSKSEFKSIIRDINQSQKTDKDWDLFKKYFENVKKDFNKKLTELNPDLSTSDFRLAALVSLNLNIKETAALLNISPDSVKVARYRLRKKLAIKKGIDLYAFLTEL